MTTSIGAGGGAGPKVSRAHVDPHPVAKPEPTVTWPVKDSDVLVGTVKLSKGVYECVLPDGSIIETFKTHKFALEFLHQRARTIPPEQQATRLKADIDQLSRQSPTEWRFWLADYAKRHGIDESKLQKMIEAEIEANAKKVREQRRQEQAAERRREQREEKKARQDKTKQREERQERERQERRDRREARDQERADREAQQRRRDIDRAFATIIELPSAEHDPHLMELATRLGEDLDTLRTQFFELLDAERERRLIGDVEPWDEPVDVSALLTDVKKQFECYVVVHDKDAGIIIPLWIALAWVHEAAATYSPFLLFTGPEPGVGKTAACAAVKQLTPRAQITAELTGPSFFHFVDHVHPTLIIDDADKLLKRKVDLAHLLNVSWSRVDAKIPRVWHGTERLYDVFCPKLIAGKNVQMDDTTMSRAIIIKLLPKLKHEKVEHLRNAARDERFLELRRKLARFALDHAEALRNANADMPAAFNNRVEGNWELLFAMADLAGGSWPKKARDAAVNLTHERDEPSEGKRLLKGCHQLFTAHGYEITSAQVRERLLADPDGEWANYHGRGPITTWQIAKILKLYGIKPGVIHPRGRPADRGYKLNKAFVTAFRHYLGVEPPARTRVRKQRQ